MNNGWISRLLGLKVEELSSGDGRKSASQLRLPTLDERVSIYTRAVSEQHDLGNEAYADARSRILDAMANDIAIKAGIKFPEELEHPRLPQDANPNETGWRRDLLGYQHGYAPARSQVLASPVPAALELSERFEHTPDLLADLSVASLAKAGVVAQAAAAQRIAPTRRPALRLAALAASIFAVAVIGASVTMSLLKDSGSLPEWAGVAPKSGKLEVAAQSSQNPSKASPQAAERNEPIRQTVRSASAPVSPAEPPGQLAMTSPTPSSSASAVIPLAQSPSLASSAPLPTQQLTPEEIANLVKLGRELIAIGKIRDARLALKRAADAGDATAAFVLATTYDPVEAGKLGARDADPNIAMAGAWYQKAKDLGFAGGNR